MLRNFRMFICFAFCIFAMSDLLWAQIAVPLDSGQTSTAILFQFDGKSYVLGLADFVSTSESQSHSIKYQDQQHLLNLVTSDWGHGLALFQTEIPPDNLPELRVIPPELLMELTIAGQPANLMVKKGERHDYALIRHVLQVEMEPLRTSFAGHPVLDSNTGGFVGLMTQRWLEEIPSRGFLLHSAYPISNTPLWGSGIVIPAAHIVAWIQAKLNDPKATLPLDGEEMQRGRLGVLAARAFWTVLNYATIGVTTALAGKVDPFGIGGESAPGEQHVVLRVHPKARNTNPSSTIGQPAWVRLFEDRLLNSTNIRYLYKIENGKILGTQARTLGDFFRLAFNEGFQVVLPYQGHKDELPSLRNQRQQGRKLLELLQEYPELEAPYLEIYNRILTLGILLQSENVSDVTPEIVQTLIRDIPYAPLRQKISGILTLIETQPLRCESLFSGAAQ